MKLPIVIAAVLLQITAETFYLQAAEPAASNTIAVVAVQVTTNASAVANADLPVITPTGTMTLLGKPQALFRVKSGAAGETAYLLAVGESRAGIKVLAVDTAKDAVTFDNHGVVQKISIKPAVPSRVTAPAPIADAETDENIVRPLVPRPFAGGIAVAARTPRPAWKKINGIGAENNPDASANAPMYPALHFLSRLNEQSAGLQEADMPAYQQLLIPRNAVPTPGPQAMPNLPAWQSFPGPIQAGGGAPY